MEEQVKELREGFHEACYLLSQGRPGEYREVMMMEVFAFMRFIETAKKYQSK